MIIAQKLKGGKNEHTVIPLWHALPSNNFLKKKEKIEHSPSHFDIDTKGSLTFSSAKPN